MTTSSSFTSLFLDFTNTRERASKNSEFRARFSSSNQHSSSSASREVIKDQNRAISITIPRN